MKMGPLVSFPDGAASRYEAKRPGRKRAVVKAGASRASGARLALTGVRAPVKAAWDASVSDGGGRKPLPRWWALGFSFGSCGSSVAASIRKRPDHEGNRGLENDETRSFRWDRVSHSGGADRSRTGDRDFADLCLTTWPRRHVKRRLTRWLAFILWSGKRDLNPRRLPWQGSTLPLSYSREPSFQTTFWATWIPQERISVKLFSGRFGKKSESPEEARDRNRNPFENH